MEVAPGRLLKSIEEVVEGGVPELVALAVDLHPIEEPLLPHPSDQLLQDRRALRIGDAVEIQMDRFDVGDVGHDRVSRGELILPVGPGLLCVGERRPSFGPVGPLHER